MHQKKFLLLLAIFSVKSFAKNFPPKVITDAETRAAVSEIEKISIPDEGFKIFFYDKKFAELSNDDTSFPDLDLKKAVELSEGLHGVAVTVKEYKPATNYTFEEYDCHLHLIVDHKDDYWLSDDKVGLNYKTQQLARDLRDITTNYPYVNTNKYYYMRSFIGNINKDNNFLPTLHGSLNIDSYIKNAYKNMDYLKYDIPCHTLSETINTISVWQEKKSGPDFQWERKFHYRKDFYIFTIPQNLLKQACPYIKKASYHFSWNSDLNIFIYQPDYEPTDFIARLDMYFCNFNN